MMIRWSGLAMIWWQVSISLSRWPFLGKGYSSTQLIFDYNQKILHLGNREAVFSLTKIAVILMDGKELLQYINKMISSQKMDTHPYSGSVAESVAFGQKEGSAHTPVYKVNIVAFNRDFSDFGDMNIDDSMHHQATKSDHKTFKCFKCFGKKASIPTSILRNEGHHKCRQCEGLEYINQSHPLVAIMEQIIRRKLPHLPIKSQQRAHQNKRETLELEYGCRDAIKEESFSYQEDSPPFCRNCNKQCDANAYRTCQKCLDFNICQLCFEKKRFSHYHPLVLKDTSRFPSRMLASPSHIKKNPQLADSQTQQYLEDLQLKCSNCCQMIDICYQACLNCENKNIKYYICNTCSQSQQYDHNRMHQLQLRTISGLSQLNRLESSQSVHENLELISLTNSIHQDISRSVVRFNHDLMNDSCEGSNNNSQLLFEKDSQGLTEEIVFNLSDHMFDEQPAIRHKLSNTCRNQREHQNKRKRDESPSSKKDDGSVVSGDLSSSLLLLKCPDSQPPSPTVPFVPIFNTITHQSIHPLHKTNPQDQYIFNDYQCDMCSVNPIRNKRYHCKECQDYDLCESCYIIRHKEHQHRDFEEIDGFELINQRNSLLRSIRMKVSSELRRTMK